MKSRISHLASRISHPLVGVRLSVLFLSFTILLSCASNKHKPHKKLKPGKPIPCPQKDC